MFSEDHEAQEKAALTHPLFSSPSLKRSFVSPDTSEASSLGSFSVGWGGEARGERDILSSVT